MIHTRPGTIVRLVLGLSILLSMLAVTARPVAAAYPGDNGRLVWSSDRGPGTGTNLFTSDLDGGNVVQITFGVAHDIDAVWSPGGQRIAFTRYVSQEFDDGEIYVINADGTGLARVTNNPADDYRPTWSPDANLIAFTSNRGSGNYHLYSTTIDGLTRRQVFAEPGSWSLEPSWHPNNLDVILFSWWRAGETPRLATFSFDQGGIQSILTTPSSSHFDTYPDWAPSGNSYTWARLVCGETTCDSRVMSRFGNSAWEVAAAQPGIDQHPSWAPDGTRIYYSTNATDPDLTDAIAVHDIFSVGPTGGDNTAVTNNASSFSFDVNVQPIPDFPLVDARFSSFEEAIVWVFENGITTGCDAERYCANAPVTRGQMATFLDRAMDLPDATLDYFTDDNGTTHEDSINRVREAEIAFGCTATTYCPNNVVTRGQMAAFLDRALGLPDATQDYFTDDTGSSFEDSINRVREAEVAFGCTATTFCPTAQLTRGQMAAFLFRAFAP